MRAALLAISTAMAIGALAAVAAGHPSEKGERYVSVAWQPNQGNGEPAGRKIGVYWSYTTGFGCQYRPHSVSARETKKSVTIKVLVHKRELKPGETCTTELAGDHGVAKLREPLGNRKLRHAPTTD